MSTSAKRSPGADGYPPGTYPGAKDPREVEDERPAPWERPVHRRDPDDEIGAARRRVADLGVPPAASDWRDR